MSVKEGQVKQIEQLQRSLDAERTRRYELELALSTIRQETIEECANLRFNIQPNGYGFNGRARLSWDLALQTYQETIRKLKERK
jgi:hypothetical protein